MQKIRAGNPKGFLSNHIRKKNLFFIPLQKPTGFFRYIPDFKGISETKASSLYTKLFHTLLFTIETYTIITNTLKACQRQLLKAEIKQ